MTPAPAVSAFSSHGSVEGSSRWLAEKLYNTPTLGRARRSPWIMVL